LINFSSKGAKEWKTQNAVKNANLELEAKIMKMEHTINQAKPKT
jgi:hypothetical protein